MSETKEKPTKKDPFFKVGDEVTFMDPKDYLLDSGKIGFFFGGEKGGHFYGKKTIVTGIRREIHTEKSDYDFIDASPCRSITVKTPDGYGTYSMLEKEFEEYYDKDFIKNIEKERKKREKEERLKKTPFFPTDSNHYYITGENNKTFIRNGCTDHLWSSSTNRYIFIFPSELVSKEAFYNFILILKKTFLPILKVYSEVINYGKTSGYFSNITSVSAPTKIKELPNVAAYAVKSDSSAYIASRYLIAVFMRTFQTNREMFNKIFSNINIVGCNIKHLLVYLTLSCVYLDTFKNSGYRVFSPERTFIYFKAISEISLANSNEQCFSRMAFNRMSNGDYAKIRAMLQEVIEIATSTRTNKVKEVFDLYLESTKEIYKKEKDLRIKDIFL